MALASPPPREVSWFYMWGNGSYHMSGLGTDDASRPDVVKRHSDHIETSGRLARSPRETSNFAPDGIETT